MWWLYFCKVIDVQPFEKSNRWESYEHKQHFPSPPSIGPDPDAQRKLFPAHFPI